MHRLPSRLFRKICLEAPGLTFTNFNKPFLLKTNTSKLVLGVVLSQKQPDGQYHPVAYASGSLTAHECNYHLTKQEFLALKWVIVEQFQEYLHWKPFVVKTDNTPLTSILTTPNLDATQHHWLESLAGFTFSIEYQKGRDNAVADSLSHVRNCEVHPRWSHHMDHRKADTHDPAVAEADEKLLD